MKTITVTVDDKTYKMPAGRSVTDQRLAQFIFSCRGVEILYQ
jgi:hypothetical protein